MPLVLGFAGLLGMVLLLTSAVTGASFADVVAGKATDVYREHQAAHDAAAASTSSTSSSAAAASTSSSAPASGAIVSSGYVSPWGRGAKTADGRVDEGVDPTIKAGGHILAIGNAKIVALQHNFYGTTPYLVYQLLDGPFKGMRVYVAEYFRPTVAPGDTVRAGQTIGLGTGRAIETGWAGGPGGSYLPTANKAQGGTYNEGDVTQQGRSFASFLQQLGARG